MGSKLTSSNNGTSLSRCRSRGSSSGCPAKSGQLGFTSGTAKQAAVASRPLSVTYPGVGPGAVVAVVLGHRGCIWSG